MIGYYSSGFDCIVVMNQNARYGIENTEFNFSLDVMDLPGVHGRLEEAGRSFGIVSETTHRALADVWLTAQIAEKVAGTHDIESLDSALRIVNRETTQYSPRERRMAELLSFYKDGSGLPNLDEFAQNHGVKANTAVADVLRLIESGDMPASVLEDRGVQDWLDQMLPGAIDACWSSNEEQRLKPLMLYLQEDAPAGFDYTQLKLGLARWKKQTG